MAYTLFSETSLPLRTWHHDNVKPLEKLLTSQVALVAKNPPANAGAAGDTGSVPGGEEPWRRQWQPTPHSCLENESHGRRSRGLQSVGMQTCRGGQRRESGRMGPGEWLGRASPGQSRIQGSTGSTGEERAAPLFTEHCLWEHLTDKHGAGGTPLVVQPALHCRGRRSNPWAGH